MRLNDKLIRRNCPACDGEITLETSALDKKITCPRCRETVVIASGIAVPSQPSKKRPAAKRKREEEHFSSEKAPASLEELRISIQRHGEGEEAPSPVVYESPAPDKSAVVYCICNGVLKRCSGDNTCCVKHEFCVLADEVEL